MKFWRLKIFMKFKSEENFNVYFESGAANFMKINFALDIQKCAISIKIAWKATHISFLNCCCNVKLISVDIKNERGEEGKSSFNISKIIVSKIGKMWEEQKNFSWTSEKERERERKRDEKIGKWEERKCGKIRPYNTSHTFSGN